MKDLIMRRSFRALDRNHFKNFLLSIDPTKPIKPTYKIDNQLQISSSNRKNYKS